MPGISDKKRAYAARLCRYINTYQRIFVVLADNVGSRQLQQIRLALRGTAEVRACRSACVPRALVASALLCPRRRALCVSVGVCLTPRSLRPAPAVRR